VLVKPLPSVSGDLRSRAQQLAKKLQTQLPEQRWRRWAGAGLILLVVVTGSTLMLRKRSIEAYVTADVITIESPIDGVVSKEEITAGQLFKPGETVIAINAARDNAEQLAEKEQELSDLEAEMSTLKDELRTYETIHLKRLQADVGQQERTLKDLEAQLKRYSEQTSNYERLVKAGAISDDRLLEARSMRDSLRQRVNNQVQLISQLKVELEATQASPRGGLGAISSSSRRMEMMEVQLVRILSRTKELQKQQLVLERQLKTAQAQAHFTYRPRFPGVVLTSRYSVGDEVTDGSTLLSVVNCNDLRVEALFEASKVKDLHIGQKVRIRWPRQWGTTPGAIVSFRGEQGVNGLETSGVAKFRPAHADRTRVLISIPRSAQNSQECRLGERVSIDI